MYGFPTTSECKSMRGVQKGSNKFDYLSTSMRALLKLKSQTDNISFVGPHQFPKISGQKRQKPLTALFTKPPDGQPPYRTGSGGCSVRRFPIDIFPFCRERPVTKEPAAL